MSKQCSKPKEGDSFEKEIGSNKEHDDNIDEKAKTSHQLYISLSL